VFDLEINHVLFSWLGSPSTWTQLDTVAAAIILSPNGALYERQTSGNLWMYNSDGWTELDSSNATQIGMAADGALIELTVNGNLWKRTWTGTAYTWTQIDSGVSSFTITNGYQLNPNPGSPIDV
jgi:hypothetical protein